MGKGGGNSGCGGRSGAARREGLLGSIRENENPRQKGVTRGQGLAAPEQALGGSEDGQGRHVGC